MGQLTSASDIILGTLSEVEKLNHEIKEALETVLDLRAEIERRKAATEMLLRNVGDPGICRGCKHEIWWVKHRNGKRAPYDKTGITHFSSCSEADQFRKDKHA